MNLSAPISLNHAVQGDERIRTAVSRVTTGGAFNV